MSLVTDWVTVVFFVAEKILFWKKKLIFCFNEERQWRSRESLSTSLQPEAVEVSEIILSKYSKPKLTKFLILPTPHKTKKQNKQNNSATFCKN